MAQKAGVSVATVSHVINDTRFVSDELIERVEKVMEDMDYQPNLLAGSLRKKKTGTIGLIIPDSSNTLFAKISKKIEDVFFLQNYNVIVCNSAYDIKRELEYLRTLRAKMVDGILIVPVTLESDHLKKFKRFGIPIVILDRSIPGINIDTIIVDNFNSGYNAAKYLISLGHEIIGYIDRIYDHSHSLERKNGFIKAMQENGLLLDKKNIVRGGFTFEDGARAAKELIGRNSGITAIFSFNDINALGAMRGLADLGLKIPEDISVMGNDDMPFSSVYVPSLTTIHYPTEEIAGKASSLLLKKISDSNIKRPKKITIPTELIIRESTAAINKTAV
ncbi:MAG: LacI family DNA-binding transcriptional regulator [Actinomycetota bacterium]